MSEKNVLICRWVRLISLNMSPMPIHYPSRNMTLLLVMTEWHSIVGICPIVFIHPSTDWPLGWPCNLASVDSASVNVVVQMLFADVDAVCWLWSGISPRAYSKMRLSHMTARLLIIEMPLICCFLQDRFSESQYSSDFVEISMCFWFEFPLCLRFYWLFICPSTDKTICSSSSWLLGLFMYCVY